jgi:predicted lipoprotein with Yx(FWY)xxD motif
MEPALSCRSNAAKIGDGTAMNKHRPIMGRRQLLLTAASLLALGPARAAINIDAPYPAEVSLTDEGDKGFVFRRCPGNTRLYVSDADKNGHPACTGTCETNWLPVRAPADARTLGEWTPVRRDDGSLQWAYRGRPVYSLIQDLPYAPKADGQGGTWHLLPYEKK